MIAEEYWRSHHTYQTVNRTVVTDSKISDKVNRSPEFWELNSVALQTTLFIAFGRLFDTRHDAHSILKFVDATIANPQFFSKTELRMRKRKASSIHSPDDSDWLNLRE